MPDRTDVEPRLVGDGAQGRALEAVAYGDAEEGVHDLAAAGFPVHLFGHGPFLSRL